MDMFSAADRNHLVPVRPANGDGNPVAADQYSRVAGNAIRNLVHIEALMQPLREGVDLTLPFKSLPHAPLLLPRVKRRDEVRNGRKKLQIASGSRWSHRLGQP